MEHQLTYMDIKRKEQRKIDFNENIKGIVGALALFVMYAIVSTMDYQDCLRGATCYNNMKRLFISTTTFSTRKMQGYLICLMRLKTRQYTFGSTVIRLGSRISILQHSAEA